MQDCRRYLHSFFSCHHCLDQHVWWMWNLWRAALLLAAWLPCSQSGRLRTLIFVLLPLFPGSLFLISFFRGWRSYFHPKCLAPLSSSGLRNPWQQEKGSRWSHTTHMHICVRARANTHTQACTIFSPTPFFDSGSPAWGPQREEAFLAAVPIRHTGLMVLGAQGFPVTMQQLRWSSIASPSECSNSSYFSGAGK